jgi:hypothetical protein
MRKRIALAALTAAMVAGAGACGAANGGAAGTAEGAEALAGAAAAKRGGGETPAPAPVGEEGEIPSTSIPTTGPVPDLCVRIEGSDIGREGLQVVLADRTVDITGWTQKDGARGEFVGFTYVVSSGTVTYAVKAGTGSFPGEASPWAHPAGTGGRAAHAISNVTFCPGGGDGGGTPDAGGEAPDAGGEAPDAGGEAPDAGNGGGTPDAGATCESDADCADGKVCNTSLGVCEVPIG